MNERWLFLRSAHGGAALDLPPPPPLEAQTDAWTLLFASLCRRRGAIGRIWRKANRPGLCRYDEFLDEVRSPSPIFDDGFGPTHIFNRGGYGAYGPALEAASGAVAVYYGAGMRYAPRDGRNYRLVLVDAPSQMQEVQGAAPGALVKTFFKPAPPQFRPMPGVAKAWDCVFVAHSPSEAKGLAWVARRLPRGTSILRIGAEDPWFRAAARKGLFSVRFTGRVPHAEVPALLAQACVGLAVDDGRFDSGPRILSEQLACGLPVLLRDTVRVDRAFYSNNRAVVEVNDATFRSLFIRTLAKVERMGDAAWAAKRLGVTEAAQRLSNLVDEAR